MFNWKILDSEATIKFLQEKGLEDTHGSLHLLI